MCVCVCVCVWTYTRRRMSEKYHGYVLTQLFPLDVTAMVFKCLFFYWDADCFQWCTMVYRNGEQ